MATRRTLGVAWAAMITVLAISACSSPVRYKVLNFFFDGVPEPGAVSQAPKDERNVDDVAIPDEEEATKDRPAAVVMYPHPPYRDGRCGGCHDQTTGGLFRSVKGGLCRSCHENVPGKVRYVHGPVAVSDCLFCHHQHTSRIPKLLLVGPNETCLRCHSGDDLTEGTHHERLEETTCISCHNPHGGDHRFFLKRTEK